MSDTTTSFGVREVDGIGVIDITGDVTPASDDALQSAYGKASQDGTRTVILNFTDLDYMNSGGIGLLVQLLVRANRSKHGLQAYGLSDHYRQIFELTRLDEAIGIHDDEAAAVAAAAR